MTLYKVNRITDAGGGIKRGISRGAKKTLGGKLAKEAAEEADDILGDLARRMSGSGVGREPASGALDDYSVVKGWVEDQAKSLEIMDEGGVNIYKAEDVLEDIEKVDDVLEGGKVLEGGSGAGKYQGPDLKISDKQFGKKVGKHAEDFGLDAKNPNSRNWVRDKINDIFKNPTQIKEGQWRGLGPIQESGNNAPGSARFFIQENDVVVTDLDGNFVTILKDGINNSRVVDAVKIWP